MCTRARATARSLPKDLSGAAVLTILACSIGCAGPGGGGGRGASDDSDSRTAVDSRNATGSPPLDAAAVLDAVAERGRGIDRFDAQLDLSLLRADGAAAELAGTLRMSKPDRMRLRSTKFGFLVCDVVVADGDAWAILSPVVRDQARASAEATHDLLRVLGSLLGWRADGTGPFVVVSEKGDRLMVESAEDSGTRLRWTLSRDDGRVLEVRRLDGDAVLGVLRCSGHRFVDGVPIPCVLEFESSTGTIGVQIHRPRLNGSQAADAFRVPAGAERIE